MGEPGTSGDGGSGETSSSTSSASAGAEGGCAGGSGGAEGGVCCSAVELDPAVVASMTADELKKFIETGRTGRRNALPDVTEHGVVSTSTAGVAEAMESLNVGDTDKSPDGAAGGS